MDLKAKYRQNGVADYSGDHFGKIPPQARSLELAVLGACLIESNAISEIAGTLTPEMFYVDAHGIIFNSIKSLYEKSQPIDILTVSEDLRNKGKLEKTGGVYFLNELSTNIGSSANIKTHAKIIVQKHILRELIRISSDLQRDSYEDATDCFDLLNSANERLLTLNNINTSGIKSVAQIELKIRKSLIERKPIAKLFKIGIGEMDFMAKTFNVIGGFPGTGKTAFMLTASQNMEKKGFKVGIFSIEMSDEMLVARMIQTKNSIPAKRIISNDLTDEEIEEILSEQSLTENIYVDDSTDITNENILTRVKAFILKYELDFVWIDFMQIVEIIESKKLDVRIIEIISRGLQNIAKSLDKCIVALSQLSKTKDNVKPTYSNIRGGGMEQAASDIYLLYDEFFTQNDGVSWKDIPYERRGQIQCIYAKGRYSEVSSSVLYFDKPRQTIMDWKDKPVITLTEMNWGNKKEEKDNTIF